MVVIYSEANAESYEHVGNLRDSRESQTTLDITLAASYSCCIECGEGCNVSYIVQSLRSILYPDWEEAGYLINTCYNHGSGVSQREKQVLDPPSHLATKCAMGTSHSYRHHR